ncbi:GNAT family N-acetyltransferase [Cytobacillus firmus]|uniref:GNAT family N-acetyltransferase n=1 Tax=Cytobacillus firmus TaxID=1399 RepID=UPI001C969DF5|nr:GNAT family N-acetyltransferase [Cytobacillus firmus]MBY6051870.1 GNAT family N-acetyltransferase [Cytobacillus firmus]URT71776.1 GNAT family N-acetyltransferase [Cytobacillus firmus]USK39806.1 GNAT family N-acetyltransferase [Cytobacillus firmus]WHY62656.1 GNAT family N-acetyltransferase [Cytobacillus firmus]
MIEYKVDIEGISPDMLDGFFDGWPNPPSPEKHLKLLKNSTKIVLAVDRDKHAVAGFITAISDGVLSAYIPLLEVLPEYQQQGIGQKLVTRMLEELDGIYMIDIMCDPELQPFYEKFGMIKSSGMVQRNYHNQSGKQ